MALLHLPLSAVDEAQLRAYVQVFRSGIVESVASSIAAGERPEGVPPRLLIYEAARRNDYVIWTSTLSLVEVNRKDDEAGKPKPLDPKALAEITNLMEQPFVKLVPVDLEIAKSAQRLIREVPKLSKRPDAIHLASAIKYSVDALHTYDGSDLLHLDGKVSDKKGRPLTICVPDKDSDGPLFAHGKKGK